LDIAKKPIRKIASLTPTRIAGNLPPKDFSQGNVLVVDSNETSIERSAHWTISVPERTEYGFEGIEGSCDRD
jgi:hypothetical protein